MQATHTDTMTGQICAPQTLLTLYLAVSTRLYREGLQQALGNSLHLNVVGASGNISAVVQEVNTLRPDIVLVDVSVDGFLASIASIRPARASTRIVALAVPDAPDSAIACAEAGVSGYVTRDGSIEDLARIILSAHAGEFECSPSVAAALALRVAERHAGAAPRLNLNCLTQRELQIIRLLEQGLSNKAIARDLSITVPTVKNHVHNIIEKLHVRGRCQAAALYRRLTLLASPL